MAADSGDIVDRVVQLEEGFLALRLLVTGPEAATATAADMELRLFRELLTMGRRLLELFFLTRAASRPAVPVAPDGTLLSECHRRPTTYLSVFGKISFQRHRFFAPGQAGVSPLDEALSLPERCYSSLLRDWAGHEVVDAAYDLCAQTLERILGLSLAKSALETLVQDDAEDVDAFYAQKPLPTAAAEGSILVVQADGAGVRLVGTEPSERTGHQTSKRETVVTTVYSIQPNVRTPQEVADALLRETDRDNPPRPRGLRPAPIGKETRATLDGKAAAFARLRERVERRDGTHIQQRVALTDGAEAYQDRMNSTFPNFTLVLDILHVLTYLWPAAQALHGGWPSPASRAYMRAQLPVLLAGQTQAVIDDLTTRLLAATALPAYRRKPVLDAIRYFTNHASSMRYDLYLARGWPIASGVIEGACKHVVRGRLDRSGMKWARSGAHAMLQLRTVRINGDWDAYQRFHRQQVHLRRYGTAAPPDHAEAQALALAA
jgi:hypothetical protein